MDEFLRNNRSIPNTAKDLSGRRGASHDLEENLR
jgi:hypothetical protein